MSRPVELDAYFRRIGYSGVPKPDLRTLRDIVLAHTQAIPFENLDPLLRRPIRLDPAGLEEKLVHAGRGGYCFEQNLLLQHVLQALGFGVEGLAARVLWNLPAGTVTPRGHMLLLVETEDTAFLVDVGFGGQTLTAPLRLEPDVEQETPHEPFRLVRAGESYRLESRVRGEWQAVYQFDLQQQLLPDYEVTSWYLSNHPDSHFVHRLIAARTAPGTRFVLRDGDLAIHTTSGSTVRQRLRTTAELRRTLEDRFRIRLPAGAELDLVLQRIADGTGARPAQEPVAPPARQPSRIRDGDHRAGGRSYLPSP